MPHLQSLRERPERDGAARLEALAWSRYCWGSRPTARAASSRIRRNRRMW